jgi:hypothetical protein
MAKLVIVAPYYDIATYLWNPFLKGWVRRELERRGTGAILLWANDANRQKLFNAVKDPDARGVLGAMHGWEYGVIGQNNQVLLQVGDSIGPEWKKLCFAPVSCLVGRKLVPWLVEQGVPCGVGEVTEYWFTAEKLQHQGEDPEEDRLMKYYLRAEYTFWYRIAEGFTAGEAYRMMIKEYYRQSKLAEQVDEETAYYVRYDAENRKFFGDPRFRLIEGVETAIQYSVNARRDPVLKYDAITVSGKVVAKDGTTAKGKIRIAVNNKETDVELAQDGSFTVTLTFAWDKNEEKTYEVELIYWGHREGGYLPKYEETQVKVEPTLVPTKIEITDILTERSGPVVTLRVFGRLVDDAEYPVPDREVEVAVGNGEVRKAYARTNKYGEFEAKIEKSFPPLQTKAVVIARFSGDDVYQRSEASKVAEFPPNWEVVWTILGAIAIVAAAVALLLLLL